MDRIDRLGLAVVVLLAGILVIMQIGIFANTVNTASLAARVENYQFLQAEAMRMCMELGQVEGFWVNDVTYCKAVFMGDSRIIPYEELDKIINKHQ